MLCKYCNKYCKNNNSHRNHERLCRLNPDRIYVSNTLGMVAWNKGLTKGNSEKVKSMAENISKALSGRPGRKHDEISKKNLSEHAKRRRLGGHTSKQKLYYRRKDGSVVYLQSSYEIRFAILLDELNIEWSRPNPLIWVDINGNNHRYYPDFLVGDIYLDTKNDYLAIKDKPKIDAVIEQNAVDIRVVIEKFITKEFILEIKNNAEVA